MGAVGSCKWVKDRKDRLWTIAAVRGAARPSRKRGENGAKNSPFKCVLCPDTPSTWRIARDNLSAIANRSSSGPREQRQLHYEDGPGAGSSSSRWQVDISIYFELALG